MKKHLIEIAYDYAKDNFKKTPFSFKELFDAILKKNPEVKNDASDLYIELLQDIRFISLGKQKWSLRENFTLSEINKITSSMFGLEEYHEEDADKYMSDVEKKEQISKKEIAEDISDFIDEEDDDGTPSSSNDDEIEGNDSISKSNSYDDDTTDDIDVVVDDEDDDELIDDEDDQDDEDDDLDD